VTFGYHGHNEQKQIVNQLQIMAVVLYLHPEASVYLLKNGYTSAQIEAMPLVQTVLLFWWKQFQLVRDNQFKWLMLPEKEAQQSFGKMNKDLREAEQKKEGGVFTIALPALQAAYNAHLRSQRQTALLRVVEALRMHAAEHKAWPEKLEDVTVVPVPQDPWTEKPFEYTLKDGVAIIQMAAEPKPAGGLRVNQRYELTLRKADKAKLIDP
jgi:hypothetical protein